MGSSSHCSPKHQRERRKSRFSEPEGAATAAAVAVRSQNHKNSDSPETHNRFAGAGIAEAETAEAESAADSETQSAGIAAGTRSAGPGKVLVAEVEAPGNLESFAGKNRSIEAAVGSLDHTAAGSRTLAGSHLAGTDCTSLEKVLW